MTSNGRSIFRYCIMAAIVVITLASSPAEAQTGPSGAPPDPPCEYVIVPYRNIETTCIELVYDDVPPTQAAPELSGMAFGPDDTLYVVRTAAGEVWAMRDADGDRFMDEPYRVTGGLRLPVSLAFYEESLYVAGIDGVVRLDGLAEDAATVTPIVTGWDLTTGLWVGGTGVGPDGRLYVGIGAGCDGCEDVGAGRGALLSYALDGSDERVEATGLRYPADFAWHPGTGDLWILDQGRPIDGVIAGGPPGELNRFEAGANYGFPYCYGAFQPDPALAPPEPDYCLHTWPPVDLFPYQSNPSGTVFYTSDAFPAWQGDLLVVLNGSWNLPEPAGYAVIAFGFDDSQPDDTLAYVAPATERPGLFFLTELSLSGKGFFPFHPVDVVVDAQGWIYVSVQEGRIYRMRPRPAS